MAAGASEATLLDLLRYQSPETNPFRADSLIPEHLLLAVAQRLEELPCGDTTKDKYNWVLCKTKEMFELPKDAPTKQSELILRTSTRVHNFFLTVNAEEVDAPAEPLPLSYRENKSLSNRLELILSHLTPGSEESKAFYSLARCTPDSEEGELKLSLMRLLAEITVGSMPDIDSLLSGHPKKVWDVIGGFYLNAYTDALVILYNNLDLSEEAKRALFPGCDLERRPEEFKSSFQDALKDPRDDIPITKIEIRVDILEEGDITKKMRVLPDEIGSFTQLESLHLQNHSLTTLSPKIANLTKLKSFSVSGCHLTHLPDYFSTLPALERLGFYENHLVSIPKELGSIARLRELDLGRNMLSSIPQEIYLNESLHYICLVANEIREIPEGASSRRSECRVALDAENVVVLPVPLEEE